MAPKSEDQFQAIREKSIANIKETALELFAHHGYHNTSISRIAREAGISKGLLYNYFKSKKELLVTIALETIEEQGKGMQSAIESGLPPYQQLEMILDILVSNVQSDIQHWKLLTALVFQHDVMDEIRVVFQQKQAEFYMAGTELFSKLGVENPTKELMLFGAILDGLFLHHLSMPDEYPLEEMKNYILEKYKPQ